MSNISSVALVPSCYTWSGLTPGSPVNTEYEVQTCWGFSYFSLKEAQRGWAVSPEPSGPRYCKDPAGPEEPGTFPSAAGPLLTSSLQTRDAPTNSDPVGQRTGLCCGFKWTELGLQMFRKQSASQIQQQDRSTNHQPWAQSLDLLFLKPEQLEGRQKKKTH